jgi:hypothetical protein
LLRRSRSLRPISSSNQRDPAAARTRVITRNQSFTFVGDNANFSGAGQVRTVGDGFTIAQSETNGDGVVDFEIQLNGNLNLTSDNFIL